MRRLVLNIRDRIAILTLFFCVVSGPIQGGTIVTNPATNKVLGIIDLDVGGTFFDVTFTGFEQKYPEVFPTGLEINSQTLAIDIIDAVVIDLNNAGIINVQIEGHDITSVDSPLALALPQGDDGTPPYPPYDLNEVYYATMLFWTRPEHNWRMSPHYSWTHGTEDIHFGYIRMGAPQQIPEPLSLGLLLIGLAAMRVNSINLSKCRLKKTSPQAVHTG